MKEILVTYYVAEDGKKFTSKPECYEHECELKKIHNWFRTLSDIKDFCSHREGCQDCPFLQGIYCGITFQDVDGGTSEVPYNWDLKDCEGF
jgi:hypothetical protein